MESGDVEIDSSVHCSMNKWINESIGQYTIHQFPPKADAPPAQTSYSRKTELRDVPLLRIPLLSGIQKAEQKTHN